MQFKEGSKASRGVVLLSGLNMIQALTQTLRFKKLLCGIVRRGMPFIGIHWSL